MPPPAPTRGATADSGVTLEMLSSNSGGPVPYFNSGCWTEKPCHFLTLRDGVVEVRAFHEGVVEEVEVPTELVPVA